MVALNFNAREVAPNAALEPLPTGWYPVMIVGSVNKQNSKKTGSYLELEMQVLSGEHANRKTYDRLNLDNPNEVAVNIARGTLSAICHVTGVLDAQDSQQLHGIPFQALIKKVERNDKPGQFGNQIDGYRDQNGNEPGKAGGTQAATQTQQQPQQTQQQPQTQTQQPQSQPQTQAAPQQTQQEQPPAAATGGNTPPWQR